MSLIAKMTTRGKVLNVLVSGEFSLDGASLNFLEVINAVKEHRSEKILFDGRKVVGDPTIIERFYYGEFVADAVKLLTESGDYEPPQFAYVLHEPVLDPHRLAETVAINRGMHVKAFDNIEEALEWLGLDLD